MATLWQNVGNEYILNENMGFGWNPNTYDTRAYLATMAFNETAGGVGSLAVCHFQLHVSSGTLTGWNITDNWTSTGWNLMSPNMLSLGSGWYDGAAWKVPTLADILASGGAGLAISVEAEGSAVVTAGTIIGEWCNPWQFVGTVVGIDCYGHTVVTAPSSISASFSFTSDVGSSASAPGIITDQISICSALNSTRFGGLILNSSYFQAVVPSTPTGMNNNVAYSGGGFGSGDPNNSNDAGITGLVQCSPTAADNIWSGTIESSSYLGTVVLRGSTFYYEPGAETVTVT